MKGSKLWLIFAIITTSFWGVWGALIEIPEKAGFPATLGYSVWALTMIPPALVALKIIDWKLEFDKRSIILGSIIGFTGAGGQLILFQALRSGPAYLVFPFISLSPVVTIILATMFLKEGTSARGWIGIVLALIAIPLLSYQDPNSVAEGTLWIILSLLVFLAWGFQAFVMRFANETMKAESIFFYMMVTGILLIPFALLMTDWSQPINWGFKGPYLTAMIQILNAIGALTLVYAFRYGKAIIVSPMTNALAPVLTVIISLIIYAVIPHPVIIAGMVLAVVAALLLGLEEDIEPGEELEQLQQEEA
ncbi:MAG: DMT family transporter [Candidatus Marinimicrobia bacterium]|nr:DMT family transporter [Candidatus Neomarinimicrobiota bacterium]MCF7830227.1 DMT family transporter [Candidatus Neomarinimicrobiota bacterium]MCF7880844.1 DMT family transporter [Candidatus Neomarinimicrobiota bacterium]